MAVGKFDLTELDRRMRGAIDTLKKEFGGLRTGRASVHLLDPVVVNVYGARMPIMVRDFTTISFSTLFSPVPRWISPVGYGGPS